MSILPFARRRKPPAVDPHTQEIDALNDCYDKIFCAGLTEDGEKRVIQHLAEIWDERSAMRLKYVTERKGEE